MVDWLDWISEEYLDGECDKCERESVIECDKVVMKWCTG